MTRSQASSVAEYLNSIYSGPNGNCAFVEERSFQTDSNGFWVYYITTPYGVFHNGYELTLTEQSEAISNAMEFLGIA